MDVIPFNFVTYRANGLPEHLAAQMPDRGKEVDKMPTGSWPTEMQPISVLYPSGCLVNSALEHMTEHLNG